MVKNRLLEIRLKMGYKFQKDFAEMLGLDLSMYGKYENNRRQPSQEITYVILKKLEIGYFDLFYEE